MTVVRWSAHVRAVPRRRDPAPRRTHRGADSYPRKPHGRHRAHGWSRLRFRCLLARTQQRPSRTGPVAQATRGSGRPASRGRSEAGRRGGAVTDPFGTGTMSAAPVRLPLDGVQAAGGGPDLSAGYFGTSLYPAESHPPAPSGAPAPFAAPTQRPLPAPTLGATRRADQRPPGGPGESGRHDRVNPLVRAVESGAVNPHATPAVRRRNRTAGNPAARSSPGRRSPPPRSPGWPGRPPRR